MKVLTLVHVQSGAGTGFFQGGGAGELDAFEKSGFGEFYDFKLG